MSSSRVFRGSQALMAAAKAAKASATTSSGVAATKPQAPNRTSGIFKVTPVSPAMRQFLGVSEASRTDAVKKIWDYIKLNSLQNPANKREIRCDEKLKTIFDGKETVGFLDIGKLLSPHFVKTN
ncbi:protein TRI1-like [Macadamia integrifolia]|uniref:protein TRI1-like n=1 Tax=Macadamia integrifolia TaxID=60698 RepID=UPI001C4EAB1A|nr:protein TRI1-like [Macadamia integrifolia]